MEEAGVEDGAAVVDSGHGREQLAPAHALEEISGRPGLHGAADEGWIVVHREDEDRARGPDLLDPPQRGHAIEVGQAHVEQHDVGRQLLGEVDCFFGGADVSHHVDSRVGQHAAQPLADDRMIVDEQHLDRPGATTHRHAVVLRGMRTRTRVPRSFARSITLAP